LILRSDARFHFHFDPIPELDSLDDFGEPFEAAQSSPTALGGLPELVDHGEHPVARQAALGAVGPVPNGGEARLSDVAAANVNPVLGRKFVEREQRCAILRQALGGLGYLAP
jgi:hypothetical protein